MEQFEQGISQYVEEIHRVCVDNNVQNLIKS